MLEKKCVIPYIMIGDPDLKTSYQLMDMYYQSGCRIIEIGVPFSDPTADGVTIQKASQTAIENQITLGICLDFIGSSQMKYPDVKFVLMTYFNPIFKYGIDRFFKDFQGHGLIIPDLPLEEQGILKNYPENLSIALIPLISINTPLERIKEIVKNSKGFIYLMALKGLTGTKSAVLEETLSILERIRAITTLPIVAGFGIKNKDQVSEFLHHFDGVIIASQLIKHVHANEFDQLQALVEL